MRSISGEFTSLLRTEFAELDEARKEVQSAVGEITGAGGSSSSTEDVADAVRDTKAEADQSMQSLLKDGLGLGQIASELEATATEARQYVQKTADEEVTEGSLLDALEGAPEGAQTSAEPAKVGSQGRQTAVASPRADREALPSSEPVGEGADGLTESGELAGQLAFGPGMLGADQNTEGPGGEAGGLSDALSPAQHGEGETAEARQADGARKPPAQGAGDEAIGPADDSGGSAEEAAPDPGRSGGLEKTEAPGAGSYEPSPESDTPAPHDDGGSAACDDAGGQHPRPGEDAGRPASETVVEEAGAVRREPAVQEQADHSEPIGLEDDSQADNAQVKEASDV
jgi:hypothetical protein